MKCDFCARELTLSLPENLALLDHLKLQRGCNEQYGYLLENLRSSWTPNMSGG